METSVQNLPLENLIRPEDLMEEIGIKKDTYYRDVKFLNIEGIKDEEGKTWITKEDAEKIQALREHIQETGKRQGFDNNDIIINENIDDNSDIAITENQNNSTINEQENKSDNAEFSNQNNEDNFALNNNNSSHNSIENSALIKSNDNNSTLRTQNSELRTNGDEEDIYVVPSEPTDNIEVDGLVREAAKLKAREVAMPDLLKRAVADEMTEDDLPEDLKEKVNLAREAANPKFTPNMVAKTILARYRQGKVG